MDSAISPRPVDAWAESLKDYLEGRSGALIEALRDASTHSEWRAPFWQAMQELDFQNLEDFYERGPKRIRLLKDLYGVPERLIAPNRLDDLLVLTPADTGLDC